MVRSLTLLCLAVSLLMSGCDRSRSQARATRTGSCSSSRCTSAPSNSLTWYVYCLLVTVSQSGFVCALAQLRTRSQVQSVVHVLMNYLGDDNASSALDVIYFVREIVEEYPALRDNLLTKLAESFGQIRNSSVFRVALWILGNDSAVLFAVSATVLSELHAGEYAIEPAILDLALMTIRRFVFYVCYLTLSQHVCL
mgnify:CR=1 FL=1